MNLLTLSALSARKVKSNVLSVLSNVVVSSSYWIENCLVQWDGHVKWISEILPSLNLQALSSCNNYFNISSVVEFQRWWVLKSKIFGQESTYSKEFLKIRWWITVCQKVPKLYFQSQFSMSKIDGIFSKQKNSFKNINLGNH